MKNRTFTDRAFQLLSRFTGEAPQTLVGNLYSHIRNVSGNVTDVSYYGGATLVNKNDPNDPYDLWGATLGSYINSKNVVADPLLTTYLDMNLVMPSFQLQQQIKMEILKQLLLGFIPKTLYHH